MQLRLEPSRCRRARGVLAMNQHGRFETSGREHLRDVLKGGADFIAAGRVLVDRAARDGNLPAERDANRTIGRRGELGAGSYVGWRASLRSALRFVPVKEKPGRGSGPDWLSRSDKPSLDEFDFVMLGDFSQQLALGAWGVPRLTIQFDKFQLSIPEYRDRLPRRIEPTRVQYPIKTGGVIMQCL